MTTGMTEEGRTLQRVSPCMSHRAQGAHSLRRRIVSYSRSPGVTPERLNRARKLAPSQAWSAPPMPPIVTASRIATNPFVF
jgi:hypothetical protein